MPKASDAKHSKSMKKTNKDSDFSVWLMGPRAPPDNKNEKPPKEEDLLKGWSIKTIPSCPWGFEP